MRDPQWSRLGISMEEERFIRLLYSPAADSVIAQFQRKGATGASVNRLYIRRTSEVAYRLIGSPESNISFDFPTVPSDAPSLFFYETLWEDGGGSPRRILRLDLSNEGLDTIFDPSTFSWPSGVSRGWVSALVGASARGDVLTGVFGLDRSEERRGFAYWLCELDYGSHQL